MKTKFIVTAIILAIVTSVLLFLNYERLFGTSRVPVTNELPSFGQSDGIITNEQFANLAETDPVKCLETSLERYRRDVKTYKATLLKQERIQGTLHPIEEIDVVFRESPFATRLVWKKGSRLLAEGVIYPAGNNDGNMSVWISRLMKKPMDPRGSSARNSSRFCIEEFGIALGTVRTHRAWSAAQEKNELKFEYLGIQSPPSLKPRSCHVIKRICARDELDSFIMKEPIPEINDTNRRDAHSVVVIYFDTETWLQTGSELFRSDGQLIASYFFRDLNINPTLTGQEFQKFTD